MNLIKYAASGSAVVCALLFMAALYVPYRQPQHNVSVELAGAQSHAAAVPEFVGYRAWARVNKTPQYIMSRLDLMCTTPTQAQIDAEKQDPHVRHYMLCYVNPIGEHAMLQEKRPKFPVGSVIVKDKLDSPDPGSKRTLLTGMVKREAGFDPAHGDWEYIVASGDATALETRGKLANCRGCHAQKQSTDFVFRDEIGADRLALLK